VESEVVQTTASLQSSEVVSDTNNIVPLCSVAGRSPDTILVVWSCAKVVVGYYRWRSVLETQQARIVRPRISLLQPCCRAKSCVQPTIDEVLVAGRCRGESPVLHGRCFLAVFTTSALLVLVVYTYDELL
jgi:hypothetical protein